MLFYKAIDKKRMFHIHSLSLLRDESVHLVKLTPTSYISSMNWSRSARHWDKEEYCTVRHDVMLIHMMVVHQMWRAMCLCRHSIGTEQSRGRHGIEPSVVHVMRSPFSICSVEYQVFCSLFVLRQQVNDISYSSVCLTHEFTGITD